LFQVGDEHRLKDSVELLSGRNPSPGGLAGAEFIGAIREIQTPKLAIRKRFPVLHSERRVLPKMVPRKVKKIQPIVVRA
jgi:hypothetical protein